jgi:hypothetical protein
MAAARIAIVDWMDKKEGQRVAEVQKSEARHGVQSQRNGTSDWHGH